MTRGPAAGLRARTAAAREALPLHAATHLRLVRALRELHLHVQLLALADDLQLEGRAGLVLPYRAGELGVIVDRLALDADDHVARLETGLRRGTALLHRRDERSLLRFQLQLLRHVLPDRCEQDAQVTAVHPPLLLELRQDLLDEGDRNREPDVVRAADDGRVDADRFPLQVEQRSSRVARIDRSVGLEEIRVRGFGVHRPLLGADDPGSHGRFQPERLADGDDLIADLERIAVAQHGSLERLDALAFDADERDVRVGIVADDLRWIFATSVRSRLIRDHLDVVHGPEFPRPRLFDGDDVVVGQHEPVADVETRAQAFDFALLRRGRASEEATEPLHRVLRVLVPRSRLEAGWVMRPRRGSPKQARLEPGVDVDRHGPDPLHQRSERGDGGERLVAGGHRRGGRGFERGICLAPAARQHERGEHDSRDTDAENAKTRRTRTVHGGLLPANLGLLQAGRPSDAKKALLA